MIDLLIRNANLPDGREKIDIAVNNGRIEEVAPRIAGEARETLDAAGQRIPQPHRRFDGRIEAGPVRFRGRADTKPQCQTTHFKGERAAMTAMTEARTNSTDTTSIDTYRRMRRGLMIVAFFLPIVLWVWGWVWSGKFWPQSSMSYYYYYGDGAARDVFVGALWAIGVFLILYKPPHRRAKTESW
jgi:hypothetical protein